MIHGEIFRAHARTHTLALTHKHTQTHIQFLRTEAVVAHVTMRYLKMLYEVQLLFLCVHGRRIPVCWTRTCCAPAVRR